MKSTIITLTLLLTFTPPTLAQQPLWGASDAAFIGAATGDLISTRRALVNCAGCREASPIKNQWVHLGLYAGIETGLKFYEWKHPEDRGKVRAFRWVASAVIVCVA